MNNMQQSAQLTQSTPLNLVSTEQIQKYLDENKSLIMAILEYQKMGKVAECAQYQAVLQNNLMYLAAIADAQPPGSSTTSQVSKASLLSRPTSLTPNIAEQLQIPTTSVRAQGEPQMQQQQPGGPVAKLPFQLNALRPQDQQNQLLQFQQQQMQGHFIHGGGGANKGLHMLMHPGHGNMMDLRGNQRGGLEANSGGQVNSGLGLNGRE